MKTPQTLLTPEALGIDPSKKTSPTTAGPIESGGGQPARRPQGEAPSNAQTQSPSERIQAINEVFTLFRINYHNQYYKSFQTDELLISAKRLWLDGLQSFTADTILRATKDVIRNSEFLPTLHRMIETCRRCSAEALPDSHAAYVEACRAPSPKRAYAWSHPAVYHAGVKADWYFLSTSPESVARPVFVKYYDEYCQRVLAGETLALPELPALPESVELPPTSKEESRARLKALRASLDL